MRVCLVYWFLFLFIPLSLLSSKHIVGHNIMCFQMNEAEQAHMVLFVSLDGVCISMMNRAYEEVALLSLTSQPATWEVEVNDRWKMLNVELQTWLEDQWRNKQAHASLQQQFEVQYNS